MPWCTKIASSFARSVSVYQISANDEMWMCARHAVRAAMPQHAPDASGPERDGSEANAGMDAEPVRTALENCGQLQQIWAASHARADTMLAAHRTLLKG